MQKQGLRAGSLCLTAALGIMAFGASAQAETGAHWNVNSSAISSTLKPALKSELFAADGALLTTVGLNSTKILCTAVQLEEAVLLASGGSLGKVKFSGCKTYINSTEAQKCVPKSAGAASGVILTNLLKGLIVLLYGVEEGYELVMPDSAGLDPEFVNILLGGSCAIGAEMPVYGEVEVSDVFQEGRVEKVTHWVESGISTSLRVFQPLAFGTPATLDGGAYLSLNGGAHEGLKWSGTPG
jgi:hypothetical protein